MTVFFVLLALAAIGAVGLVAAGRLGELPEAHPDRRPELADSDPNFDVVLRGYRMDEVDAELADLRARLAAHEKGA